MSILSRVLCGYKHYRTGIYPQMYSECDRIGRLRLSKNREKPHYHQSLDTKKAASVGSFFFHATLYGAEGRTRTGTYFYG